MRRNQSATDEGAARQVHRAHGENLYQLLQGFLVLSIDPEYFSRFFATVDVGKKGVITLLGTDRVVRARSDRQALDQTIGQTLVGNRPYFEPGKPSSGCYQGTSSLDGVPRIWAYRRLQQYPLVVTVGLAVQDVYREANKRRTYLETGGVLISILLLSAASLIAWFEKNQRRVVHDLHETSQRFKLATASGRLGVWDWNIRTDTLICDVRMFEMFGILPETFTGRFDCFRQVVHPEDLDSASHAFDAAVRG